MKYLKLYEDVSRLPKLKDWVIVEPNPDYGLYENEALGQIVHEYSNKRYIIHFENTKNEKTLGVEQLKYWSNNKEELEIYIQSNKYNL